MKNLIFFFAGEYENNFQDNAFFQIPDYVKDGFLDFFKKFSKNEDINIYVCRGDLSYSGTNTFKYGFLYKNKKFIFLKEKIKADLIFNRSSVFFENGFNSNMLIKFCRNKVNFISLFSYISPKTYLINSRENLKLYLSHFTEKQKKVLKPIDGNGDGVIITNKKSEVIKYDKYPFLLQEFADTSMGIPLIYEGIHNLRLFIINGKIIYSIFMTPPKGSFICNDQKYLQLREVNLKDLGPEIYEIIKDIDSLLENVGDRYYSIDLGYTKEGIRVFELNSCPSIESLKFGTKKIHDGLYKLIIEKLK